MRMSLDAAGRSVSPLRLREIVAHPVTQIALVIAVIAVIFHETVWSMVDTWIVAETYTHGFLAVPACLWFVWKQRAVLSALPRRPWLPAFAGVVLAGTLWLVGDVASVVGVKQFAVVGMVICAVPAVLGVAWGLQLARPLAFLVFAVPFGAGFVQTLMTWTADFATFALHLSGIPVYREGSLIVIPSGNWSVIEACSGIRYLIASLMVGSFMALTMFRSPRKQLLVLALAAVLPIVANWVRAYLIILIGHLSGNRLAVGVDHLIYGWLFFSLITLAFVGVTVRFREDLEGEGSDVAPRSASGLPTAPAPGRQASGAVAVAPAFAALVAVGLTFSVFAASAKVDRVVGPASVPLVEQRGEWRAEALAEGRFEPDLKGAAVERTQTFAVSAADVTLHLAVYRNQRQESELVGSGNELVHSNNPRFRLVEQYQRPTGVDRPDQVRGAIVAHGSERMVVWHWYWLDGATTTSDVRAKLDLVLRRIAGQGDRQAAVTIATPVRTTAADAEKALARFVAEMGTSIDDALLEASSGKDKLLNQ